METASKNPTFHSQKQPRKRSASHGKSLPNEKKQLVLDCMVMRYTTKESLTYLKTKGYNIKDSRFYALRKEIISDRESRINKMALENGFAETQLSIVDSFRLIEKELWVNYHNKDNTPIQKSQILRYIMENQTYLADVYDVTKEIIREQAEIKEKMSVDLKS